MSFIYMKPSAHCFQRIILGTEWNSIVSVSFHPDTLENKWNSTVSVSFHPHTLENERNSARSVLFHNTTQHLNATVGPYMRLQNKLMLCGSCFILPSHTFLAYMVLLKIVRWNILLENDLSRNCPKVRCHIYYCIVLALTLNSSVVFDRARQSMVMSILMNWQQKNFRLLYQGMFSGILDQGREGWHGLWQSQREVMIY